MSRIRLVAFQLLVLLLHVARVSFVVFPFLHFPPPQQTPCTYVREDADGQGVAARCTAASLESQVNVAPRFQSLLDR